MERTHKMAIVGFGGMGSWHGELIETIDGLELTGIYDINPKRAEYARTRGIHAYNSYEELLADKEAELVLVATPNDLHKPLVIQALEAGKHAISEKPVTLNSTELEEIIAVMNRTGKFFTVHQNRRWDEDFLTICEILKQNKLGEIVKIESRVHGSRGIPGDWRQEKERGGGMVLDWGVHLLDQILLMMQEAKLNDVFATVTHITNQLVDDGFTAHLFFENQMEAVVEVGTSNFVNLPRWYVLGQDGTAIIYDWNLSGEIVRAEGDNEEDVVPVRTAAGLTKTMAPREEENIRREKLPKVKSDIRGFYYNVWDTIEGKADSLIRPEEVMRVMKLIETIFESAKKHSVIAFEK